VVLSVAQPNAREGAQNVSKWPCGRLLTSDKLPGESSHRHCDARLEFVVIGLRRGLAGSVFWKK